MLVPLGFVSDHMARRDLDTMRWIPANAWAWLPCTPPTLGTHPAYVESLRRLIEERVENSVSADLRLNVRASSPRARAASTAGSTSANPTAASPAEVRQPVIAEYAADADAAVCRQPLRWMRPGGCCSH